MTFVEKLRNSILQYPNNIAFHIDETQYTYAQLGIAVSSIRLVLKEQDVGQNPLVGLVTNDDFYTYASIIALWFEGKGYVPINTNAPVERNREVLVLAETTHVLDSSETSIYTDSHSVINTTKHHTSALHLDLNNSDANTLAYIIFTSGTTGVPKGVPISFANLQAFVNAIAVDPDFELVPSDRCLQMFEMTFDFSVVSYLLPLLSGASIYTIPKSAIKYFYIVKLIQEHKITVLSLVPSIIHYLQPYFQEIQAPQIRYCSFGGSALYEDIVSKWSKCIPNATIFNYYGPTECTIYSSCYKFDSQIKNKTYNGILSIGKPLHGIEFVILDQNGNESPVGELGELYIAGHQQTLEYWKREDVNQTSFMNIEGVRYYKTGDLCYVDEEGFFYYSGREDFQVKIRGYRIELSEIEFYIKQHAALNCVAIDIVNELGNTEIGMVVETKDLDVKPLITHLKENLPEYKIPTQIIQLKEFPYTINGKIDRRTIRTHFETK